MGLLDKLWDDVVAGPRPDKGLGWLRKKKLTLDIPDDNASLDEDTRKIMLDRRRSGEFQSAEGEARRVAESIAIQNGKPPTATLVYNADESRPTTPSDIGVPNSPLAIISPLTRTAEFTESRGKIRRTMFHTWSSKEPLGSSKVDQAHPNSPTVHDWVVISVLDR